MEELLIYIKISINSDKKAISNTVSAETAFANLA